MIRLYYASFYCFFASFSAFESHIGSPSHLPACWGGNEGLNTILEFWGRTTSWRKSNEKNLKFQRKALKNRNFQKFWRKITENRRDFLSSVLFFHWTYQPPRLTLADHWNYAIPFCCSKVKLAARQLMSRNFGQNRAHQKFRENRRGVSMWTANRLLLSLLLKIDRSSAHLSLHSSSLSLAVLILILSPWSFAQITFASLRVHTASYFA